MLALGAALAARGHRVVYETWQKWRADVEAAGMEFVAAPEYHVFPTREKPLKPYEAAARAALETRAQLEARGPFDGVVHDVLTPAPALAAELCGVRSATLIPHLHPHMPSGQPVYSVGARLPRTALGRAFWRAWDPAVRLGLEHGRAEYNDCRARIGLPPVDRLHPGISTELALVATLPQLEYPRAWPASTHVIGPAMWEPPGEPVAPPPGDGPVVLIAPSTSQDPEHALLRASLAGLAGERVRVIATWNGRPPARPLPQPGNAVVVPWVQYSATMPRCDLVVCHGGHGTLMRALASGCRVVVCPAAGDMAENAARIDWAGLGVRLPRRLLSPATLRLAVRRALADRDAAQRARDVAAAAPDGAARGAELIERWLIQ